MFSLIRKSKKKYFSDKFEAARGDSSRMWRTVGELMPRKHRPQIHSLCDKNGKTIEDDKGMADSFIEYFTNIASDLASKIPCSNKDPLSYMGPPREASFEYAPCISDEVISVIKSFPVKMVDINEIPIFIFKTLSSIITPIIANFFTESVSSGCFPEVLKCARIVPVYKKGDRRDIGNYRPISTLSTMSKIFEKLMYIRVQSFLSLESIISPHQFGFRPKFSTSDAIVEYLDNVYEALDRRESVISIFLDLSKAFDTVNHNILLKKLDFLGIRGNVGDWFSSYLHNRTQYVSVNGTSSHVRSVNCGVPQGSQIGPLLFTLYINDMSNSTSSLQFVHYADDTTVYRSGRDVNAVISDVNGALIDVDQWLRVNRLSLNVSKTEFIIITRNKNIPRESIVIGDRPLKRQIKKEFLGILIDCDLNFSFHLAEITRKLSRCVGILYKIRPYVTDRILRMLYFSLFYSRMSYAIVAWGSSPQTYLNGVQVVQRRAIRLLKPGSRSREAFMDLNVLQFNTVYIYFLLVKLFRTVHGGHNYFQNRITANQVAHPYKTRPKVNDDLRTPFCRTTIAQRSFLFRGVQSWNSLPHQLRMIESETTFKRQLRDYLLINQNLK